jgi:hypothetical protein
MEGTLDGKLAQKTALFMELHFSVSENACSQQLSFDLKADARACSRRSRRMV